MTATPKTGHSQKPKDHALELLQFGHSVLMKQIESFPPDKALFQPTPTDNHLMWTLGHLAMTYAWAVSLFDGKGVQLPESYEAKFSSGSKPTPNAADYPRLAELRRQFEAAYDEMVQTALGLSDEDLRVSIADKTGGFATDRLDLLMKMSWHDGWHGGQLASLTRAFKS